MPQFVAVTPEQHGGKAWRRFDSYAFAIKEPIVPIVAAELANASHAMPLAFIEQAGRYILVAVLSLAPGRNMFVTPDGRWLGGYVPAVFRGYPFRLLRQGEGKDWIFCIDEEAKFVTPSTAGAELIFDAEGKLAPAAKTIFDFLGQVERNAAATNAAVSALADARVICPWPIKLKAGDKEQPVSGLHRIDEAALNALGEEAFLKLRKASALSIAYAQLLSMSQIAVFERLGKLQAQLAQSAAQTQKPALPLPESLDTLFSLPDDGTVRFG